MTVSRSIGLAMLAATALCGPGLSHVHAANGKAAAPYDVVREFYFEESGCSK